ncbi:MAG: DinB family protein [Thermoplasmata archaeon]|nr:DinB family protein [Thermoplasmata archaeon]
MKASRAPLSVEAAQALFVYNRGVFDRFVARVERLPAKASRRSRGIGHLSLFDTLVHILNVHEAWVVYIVPGRVRELVVRFRQPDRHPKDWAGFHAYETLVWTGVDAYLAGLSAKELRRTVRAPWMPGRYTVSDALFQTTFEEAHHLGEIIGALWQEDRAPPDMTWIDIGRGPVRKATRPKSRR